MRLLPIVLLLLAACSSAPQSVETSDAPGEFESLWRTSLVPGQRATWLDRQQSDPKEKAGYRPFIEYEVKDPLLKNELRHLWPHPSEGETLVYEVRSIGGFRACPWGTAPMPFGRHPLGPWDVGESEVRP